jgi:integrase/recombinase XerD
VSALAPTLQAFFTDRLIRQRQASPHTIAAYRDAFRLLVRYAAQASGKPPARLDFDDLDAATISGFLTHLERDRGASVATRNARLTAIRSLFTFAALRHPEHAALIARVLAIPAKRGDRTLVSFLSRAEVDALLAAPDRTRWTGRRDHALLTFDVQTGLRVSELAGSRCADLALGRGPHVRVTGKGRKERVTPLTGHTVAVLRAWLDERRGAPAGPGLPGPGRPPARTRRDPQARAQVRARRRLPLAHSETGGGSHPAAHLCNEPPAERSRSRDYRALAGP